MDYVQTLRNFVVETFLFGDGDQLQGDTSFTKKSIMDSTGVLELISFLEETFNIKIEDAEVVPDNLDSLQNLSRFLEQKVSNNT